MAPEVKTAIFGGDKMVDIVRPSHLSLLETVTNLKQDMEICLSNLNFQEEKEPVESSEDEHVITSDEEEEWKEERLISEIKCEVERDGKELRLNLLLRLEDSMNRQLNKTISEKQSGMELATDLVYYGLINENDHKKVALIIQNEIDTVSTL